MVFHLLSRNLLVHSAFLSGRGNFRIKFRLSLKVVGIALFKVLAESIPDIMLIPIKIPSAYITSIYLTTVGHHFNNSR